MPSTDPAPSALPPEDPDPSGGPGPAADAAGPRRTSPPTPRRRPAPGRPPFELLVERHGPGVLRFCVARLGPVRGEDAFQETLLAGLRHYDELRDPGAAAGWLLTIARRKIIDATRVRADRPEARGELDEDALAWHDPEPGGGLWTLVAGLPPKQREAVGLRYLADLPHEEIGRATGTSTEAARRNVFEGLRRLRRELDDDRAP